MAGDSSGSTNPQIGFRRRRLPRKYPGWTGLIVMQVVVPTTAIAFLATIQHLRLGGTVLGLIAVFGFWSVMCGQLMLAAFATAFGPWNLLLRFVAPPLVFGAQVSLSMGFIEPKRGVAFAVLFASLGLLVWSIAVLLLWGLRTVLGTRLVSGDVHSLSARSHQFTIGQLLGITLVAASLFGLGRLAIHPDSIRQFYVFNLEYIIGFLVTSTAIVLAGLVSLQFLLSPSNFFGSMGKSTLTVLAIGAMLWLATAMLGLPGTTPGEAGILAVAMLGQHFWLALNLNEIRANGWHLRRIHRGNAQVD